MQMCSGGGVIKSKASSLLRPRLRPGRPSGVAPLPRWALLTACWSTGLITPVKIAVPVLALMLLVSGLKAATEEATLLRTVRPLPVALDPAFQFRKTKLFLMPEQAPNTAKEKPDKNGETNKNPAASKSTAVVQEASITFERQYRLFGAVTKLDQHQRFGNYFDFFWRAKRPADLVVRLEYRQEKLHHHIQAQEISYGNVNGNHKTEFKVIGDDYFDGGRVIGWRCLLVENGKIVAEDRSFLWE
jgi:hypothetical protein